MKEKRLRRYPPCPVYEIGKLESWLSDLASEGWLLEKQSAFFGYLIFRKDKPQTAHYRLEAIGKRQSRFNGDDPQEPFPEARAMYESFGWTFVMQYREFFLYRSLDPSPRELHTDPEIQAITIKQLNRRLWTALIRAILLAVFHVVLGIFAYPFSLAMAMGSLFWGGFLLLMLQQFLDQLRFLHRLRQLRARLLRGEPLQHRQDWRKGARSHAFREGLIQILSFVVLIAAVFTVVRSKTYIPLEEMTADPPFVTLEDLATPKQEALVINQINNGRCKQWRDPLFPQVWDYIDGGGIRYEDGTETAGLIEIQYCEAAFPWLARAVAREFTRFYRVSSGLWRSETSVYALPELGLDYAVGFENQFGLIRVVLAEGNRAVCCRFSLDDEKGIFTTENWMQKMARQLQEVTAE